MVASFTLALVAAVVPGCSGAAPDSDKAGGSLGGRVVLRMASTPGSLSDVPPVDYFAARVAALSGRTVQIKAVDQWGDYAPDAEAQVVHAAAEGKVDLGWAGSRVFDAMGLANFQALSAPMLIDGYPLVNAVLESSIPGEMLDSLKVVGVAGLGISAEQLRRPISARRPLLNLADWHGIAFGTYRSRIQENAVRALGATPVEAFGPFRSRALDTGEIQGFELDIPRYDRLGLAAKAPYVTANVTLWPQFNVLFANPGRLASLTDRQRSWLRQAADDATTFSEQLADREGRYVNEACSRGARFANASPSDLAGMRAPLAAVYRTIEQDPQTGAFIRQIQAMKLSTPRAPSLRVPAGCAYR